jgi:uncharacterized protein with FMN-binding domain
MAPTSEMPAVPLTAPTPSKKHWIALLQSSSLYTFQKSSSRKRKYVASTIVLSVLSLAGALAIDLHLNPNALNPSSSSTTTTGSGTTTAATGNGTATGSAIDYRYGTVQVSVTKANGKITNVTMVQSGATAGREQAFPTLIQAAVSANGSNFGNLSGATFTTDAFKQALDSAVKKLG